MDSNKNSLQDLFPGHFKDNDETLQEAWLNSLFVFDANILLNLYRYSDHTRDIFFEALEKIKDRVWLPHRAAEEYFSNRLVVIGQQEKAYDDAVTSIETIRGKFENSRNHPFVKKETADDMYRLFDQLREELQQNKSYHSNRITKDEIKAQIADIFQGNVGKPYDIDKLKTLISEGKTRYEQRIPPGFKDDAKSVNDDLFMEKCRKYGDFIIWSQVIEKANETNKSIILVTDDKKEDWWQIFKGKTLGPRPELVKEFKEKTKKLFYMYQADHFLDFAKTYLKINVSDATVAEIKQVRLDNLTSENFERALNKHQALRDMVTYIKENLNVGDNLPAERNFSEILGWNRTVVRESLKRLETFNLIRIEHGKPTTLIKDIPDIDEYD